VHFKHVLGALHFDENVLCNNEVDTKCTVERFALVNDGPRHLTLTLQVRRLELARKTGLIHGLQQPRARVPVHLYGAADDPFGNRFKSREHGR